MMTRHAVLIAFCFALLGEFAIADVDFQEQIQPILTKYCAGCHNADDLSGDLNLSSFASMQNGGKHGAAVLVGRADGSRLIQVLTGTAEPAMPPEDEPKPSTEEIEMLRQWVNAGANGPNGTPLPITPPTPRVAPSLAAKPITALAFSPDGSLLAIARFKHVELRSSESQALVGILSGHAGKINSLAFTNDGKRLIAASGITGLRGEVKIWDIAEFECVQTIDAHRDIIFSAIPSPDDKLLATASYDKQIGLWDLDSGKNIRYLDGHNGAVMDLDFSPDGKVLASASTDATIKIWDVVTGERLDTLSQPLKEQFSVSISPDGRFVFASGEDNRIRKWSLISYDEPKINPILIARFGHDQSIEKLALTKDGKIAVSASADRSIKVWNTEDLSEVKAFAEQTDSVQALALASGKIAVGRMDGSLEIYDMSIDKIGQQDSETSLVNVQPSSNIVAPNRPTNFADIEPNNQSQNAQSISIPAQVTGTINVDGDVDLYRFESKAGQQWIFEVKAARDNSPLDSKIAILDSHGDSIPRVYLQAVRDSYFTFRGKDSKQTDDFRLHNWQEMKLNQYLYAAGEVVKMFHYPRGPDSGFNVYPNFGDRHNFFDTTAVTHALGEPCYIVEPRDTKSTIVPNGLPVFTINYENDDESTRNWGSDSRIHFETPTDGEYLLMICDVRGFGGDDFKYTLAAKVPRPDFHVKLTGTNPKVAAGAGRKFGVEIERIDQFDGEIRIEIEGMPNGFSVTSPIVVESNHLQAFGAVMASSDASSPSKETTELVRVTAHALIHGEEVVKQIGSLGEIKLAGPTKVETSITPVASSDPAILELIPGQTTTANLKVTRHGYDGLISYGKEDSLQNSPHGVFVDNIGLNGVLIPEEQSERQVFVTVEPWVKPCERWVFMESDVSENPTSTPILLRVLPQPTRNQTAATE